MCRWQWRTPQVGTNSYGIAPSGWNSRSRSFKRTTQIVIYRTVNLIPSDLVKLPIFVLIMIALAAPAAAQSSGTATPSEVDKKPSPSTQTPMVFYLAKGKPNSCGPGCSEWIAAEGQIDERSMHRLPALLSLTGKHKLPIYFQSTGGVGTTATRLAVFARARDNGRRVPNHSGGLRRGERANLSSPKAVGTSASSGVAAISLAATPHAFCPDRRQGATSATGRPTWNPLCQARRRMGSRPQGRLFRAADCIVPNNQAGADQRAISPLCSRDGGGMFRLFDLSLQVPHESIYYLSRDEIVRFGVDSH